MASNKEAEPNFGIVSISKFAADRGIEPHSAEEAKALIEAYEAEKRLKLLGVSLMAGNTATKPEIQVIEAQAA